MYLCYLLIVVLSALFDAILNIYKRMVRPSLSDFLPVSFTSDMVQVLGLLQVAAQVLELPVPYFPRQRSH